MLTALPLRKESPVPTGEVPEHVVEKRIPDVLSYSSFLTMIIASVNFCN
jgi:hypothetical protein